MAIFSQLVAKLTPTRRSRLHRIDDRLLHTSTFHAGDRRIGRAAFRGHTLPEHLDRIARLRRQLRRAGKGRQRQLPALLRAQAHLQRRLLHRLEEEKHIRRPAARYRRHRIDLGFVIQPHGLADRAHDLVGSIALRLAHPSLRHHAGDPHADQGRRIRHRAHDGAIAAQPARQVRNADARRDRQQQLPAQLRRQAGGHVAHLLRLHRQHHHVAVRHLRADAGRRADAILLRQARQRLGVRVDHVQVGRIGKLSGQAGDQGRGHVAAADKCNLHLNPYLL